MQLLPLKNYLQIFIRGTNELIHVRGGGGSFSTLYMLTETSVAPALHLSSNSDLTSLL